MVYDNTKKVTKAGYNFSKCCERSDGQFYLLDGNVLTKYDTHSSNFEKKTSFSDSINDMFYSKSIDAILCSSKGNIHLVNENDKVIYKSPAQLNLNLLSVTTNKSGSLICAGAEIMKSIFDKEENDALLIFWDIRKPDVPVGYYRESHSDDIVSLSFKDNHFLLSGSLDGLVNIYDLRQSSESEALLNVLNAEDTINKCGWLSNNEMIYCFTGSEKQLLWSNQNEDYAITKNAHNLNVNHKFFSSCIENTNNEVLTLSLSEDSSQIFVDGIQTHAQISVKKDVVNNADFIMNGGCVVAYSDQNIYLYY